MYFSRIGDADFDYKVFKKNIGIIFWVFYVLYSAIWTVEYQYSDNRRDMKYVDYATSAWMFAIIAGFFILESSLIQAVSKYLGGDMEAGADAIDMLKKIITWQVIQTFL